MLLNGDNPAKAWPDLRHKAFSRPRRPETLRKEAAVGGRKTFKTQTKTAAKSFSYQPLLSSLT
jgi:hypothetical protein